MQFLEGGMTKTGIRGRMQQLSLDFCELAVDYARDFPPGKYITILKG